MGTYKCGTNRHYGELSGVQRGRWLHHPGTIWTTILYNMGNIASQSWQHCRTVWEQFRPQFATFLCTIVWWFSMHSLGAIEASFDASPCTIWVWLRLLRCSMGVALFNGFYSLGQHSNIVGRVFGHCLWLLRNILGKTSFLHVAYGTIWAKTIYSYLTTATFWVWNSARQCKAVIHAATFWVNVSQQPST